MGRWSTCSHEMGLGGYGGPEAWKEALVAPVAVYCWLPVSSSSTVGEGTTKAAAGNARPIDAAVVEGEGSEDEADIMMESRRSSVRMAS